VSLVRLRVSTYQIYTGQLYHACNNALADSIRLLPTLIEARLYRMFEMYVNVVFVIRRLYSAVSLTLVREQRFIRIIIIIIISIVISLPSQTGVSQSSKTNP